MNNVLKEEIKDEVSYLSVSCDVTSPSMRIDTTIKNIEELDAKLHLVIFRMLDVFRVTKLDKWQRIDEWYNQMDEEVNNK